MSADGVWCNCRRGDFGNGRKKDDKNGEPYWTHRLIAIEARYPEPTCSHKDSSEKAEAEITNQVYTALLKQLTLSHQHIEALTKRGMITDTRSTNSVATSLGYGTLPGPGRSRLAFKLVESGLEQHLPRTPGFFVQESASGSRYWTIGGPTGLVLPVRDHKSLIVALQCRVDEATKNKKYRFLSTKRRKGVGSGAPVHFPLYSGPTELIRITEGVLKSDLATLHTGILTVGLPGVNACRRAAHACQLVNAKTARVAFDADANKNCTVARCLADCVISLRKAGVAVELERWAPEDGKGIDDLLATGKTPEVVKGTEAVDEAVRHIVSAAELANPSSVEQSKTQVREEIDDPYRLALLWLKHSAVHELGHTWVYNRDLFWRWYGTHYREVPDHEFRAQLTRFCKQQLNRDNLAVVENWVSEKTPPPEVPKVTKSLVTNVVQATGAELLLSSEWEMPCFTDDHVRRAERILPMNNGLLDVDALLAGKEVHLLSHTPRFFSQVCLPYNFDSAALCPKWMAVLARNLGDDPGKMALFQQWAGYNLLPDTTRQKFLMMVGEGSNGKSVFCAVLQALLGEKNCSSVALELFGQRFQLNQTLGKLANIVPEVGELDRMAEGYLKAYVSGDPMEFERKFKNPFTARPTARLTLATNTPPHFKDKSDGIWRRILLLRFTVQIPKEDVVVGMDQPAWWQKSGELPGILNWALAGLHKLRQKDQFSIPPDCANDLERFRGDCDPARRFLDERYKSGSGDTKKGEIYSLYRQWCIVNGYHPLAENKFAADVFRVFRTVRSIRVNDEYTGKRVYAYGGLVPQVDETTD